MTQQQTFRARAILDQFNTYFNLHVQMHANRDVIDVIELRSARWAGSLSLAVRPQ